MVNARENDESSAPVHDADAARRAEVGAVTDLDKLYDAVMHVITAHLTGDETKAGYVLADEEDA